MKVNVNFMVESVIPIKSEIMINVGASVKTSCMWKRLYLQFCYICLQKW